MPSRRRGDRVVAVAGRVGTRPEINETDYGDVLDFRLAVTNSYDEDAEATWFDVSVWNEDLIEACAANLEVGMAIAVEGFYSVREGRNGGEFKKISATRIGPIEYFKRSKNEGSRSRRRNRDEEEDEAPRRRRPSRSSRPASRRTEPEYDDEDDTDLPF